MSKKTKATEAEVAEAQSPTLHERVTAELIQLPFSKLVTRKDDYAFRDADELTKDGLKALREDIAACGGINTPMLVAEQSDGTYLVLDAHRRHSCLAN